MSDGARLPCGGNGKPDQAVLYTAHYDHLGLDPNHPGDNIYNGAADNGTGVAMLLEMARAWSTSGIIATPLRNLRRRHRGRTRPPRL